MNIFKRFTNWMRGISPEVIDFAYPVLREVTPFLMNIARMEVAAAIDAYGHDNSNGVGDLKFAKAQAGVRAELLKAKITLRANTLDWLIKTAVGELPKA